MAASAIGLASMFLPNTQPNKNATSAQAQATSTSAGSTSSTSGLGSTTTGTTFLNLLVKELQNQDPTSPMDSTAMVGQMISLNSLDQLISINQTLSSATKATTTTPKTVAVSAPSTESSSTQIAQRNALLNSAQHASAAQLAAQAALDPSRTLDLSTLTTSNGGK